VLSVNADPSPHDHMLVTINAGHTLFLDDADAIWIVKTGRVELFAIDRAHGDKQWRLASFLPGQALFGMNIGVIAPRLQLQMKSAWGTQLLRSNWNELQSGDATLTTLLEDWVQTLLDSTVTALLPKTCQTIGIGDLLKIPSGQAFRADAGVVWVRHKKGASYWLGDRDLEPFTYNTGYFPLTPQTWLECSEDVELETQDTQRWLDAPTYEDDLNGFYQQLFTYAANHHDQVMQTAQERIQQRAVNQRRFMRGALEALAAVLQSRKRSRPEPDLLAKDPLVMACQAIGKSVGFTLTVPPYSQEYLTDSDLLNDIARASGVNLRQVTLKGEWWRTDSGAMLGFLVNTNAPVALLPINARTYHLYDPQANQVTTIDSHLAAQLLPTAYTFYRPLPAGKLNVWDLLVFSGRSRIVHDLVRVVLLGSIGGLLGLVIPLATGHLVDTIIPEAERIQLIEMALITMVSMIAAVLFQVVGAIAMMRVETRVNHDLQAAVWARLLSLPVTFFRRFSVGDLSMRAGSINSIRQMLSSVLISTLMSAVFSSFHVFLLFRYSPKFTLIAFALIGVSALMIVIVSSIALRLQRILMEKQGQLSSLILQLLNGITKLRVAGAETSAFYLWSSRFSEMRATTFRMQTTQNIAGVFNMVFPTICSMVLYAVVGADSASGDSMTTGQFLAFYSSFSTVISAATSVFGALIASLGVIPLYERAKPILETLPETASAGRHPGELHGEIEVSRVTFRYQADGPDVLKDVSLHIPAGRFVAIVGASGSGKSTLLRMLLGFEKPQTGAIYFDRQDLSQLDVQAVRRQLGVVLQNSQVMNGDILSNIMGNRRLTIDDAKEAVRMVGLEEDIAGMPMGLFTMVSEGGSTLSGGQRQRLLIARAIVAKPRIIFFDEATSALDNRTQAIVSESLEQLRATRVVIAHRLSTIRKADCIYVMDQGRIVQAGTYDELVSRPGCFYDLAQRQLA
jgi:NHLM bacteriocin system ABC transporter ATP-binding protein